MLFVVDGPTTEKDVVSSKCGNGNHKLTSRYTMKISADRQTRNRAIKLASRPYIALLDHHLDSDRNPKFNALGDWNPITLPVENATHIILKETTNKTSSYTKHAFVIVIVIVNSKLLKRHSKAKRRAPAYSRALRQ